MRSTLTSKLPFHLYSLKEQESSFPLPPRELQERDQLSDKGGELGATFPCLLSLGSTRPCSVPLICAKC